MVSVDGLTVEFGGTTLFRRATFTLNLLCLCGVYRYIYILSRVIHEFLVFFTLPGQ